MKRWLANIVITTYLGVLSFGFFAHMMQFYQSCHPGMYFVVWDMFCGWSAYENRIHIVGEGESGTYYDLSKGPWGEFNPYSDIGRRHYDYNNIYLSRVSRNVLNHTSHEPMSRIYIFEENWAKKYNMPDYVWRRLYDEPKDPKSYFYVRCEMNPESQMTQFNSCWLTQCAQGDFIKSRGLRNNVVVPSSSYSLASSQKEKRSVSSEPSKKEGGYFKNQQEPENLFTPAGN